VSLDVEHLHIDRTLGGALRTYLKRLREDREEPVDGGFTLIELLVVLLILGILLAIAIPTFLSVTKSATNTAASSNLQTALTGAETYYTTNNGSYSGLLTSQSVSNISQEGTGLSYVTTASTASGVVSVYQPTGSASNVALAAWNGSTRCYIIAAEKTTGGLSSIGAPNAVGTYYGWYNATTKTACTADPTTAVSNFQNTGGFPA